MNYRFTLGLILIVACDKQPEPAQAPADPIALITAPIDTSITLGAWMSANAHDVIDTAPPADQLRDYFCRAARSPMPVGGRAATRHALFEIPSDPSSNVPADTTRVAERVCVLRTMWLSFETPDTTSARQLIDSLTNILDQKIGAHTRALGVAAAGSREWTIGRSWTTAGSVVAMAMAPSTSSLKARRVFLIADVRHGWYSDFVKRSMAEDDYREPLWKPDLDSAIAWMQLPAVAADLRAVVAHDSAIRAAEDTTHRDAMDATLLRAIRAVRAAAPTLTPPRRAAALFAVDQVVNYTDPGMLLPADSVRRRALIALGFAFSELGLDDMYHNDRPWLLSAYTADSLGPAGHLAFMALFEQGWTSKGACEDGNDLYKGVIEHGEAAIARGDHDPRIEEGVAEAYQTIWNGAHADSTEEFINVHELRPLAESARLKAIEHYRRALVASKPPVRRKLARNLVQLLVRRYGRNYAFLCYYD